METSPFTSLFNRLKTVASEYGIRVEFEKERNLGGWLIFPNGKTSPFKIADFNVNNSAAYQVALDKNLTCSFLREKGIRVPDGRLFSKKEVYQKLHFCEVKDDVKNACDYAEKLGYPVFVKPNNLSQGRFVSCVRNEGELKQAVSEIFSVTNDFVVESVCKGNDYRLLMFNGELMAAHQCIGPSVVGDGEHSLRELLQKLNDDFLNTGGAFFCAPLKRIDLNRLLVRTDLAEDSVLPKGFVLKLSDNNNIAQGGNAVGKTEEVHPSFVEIAQRVMEVLGLKLSGIDFIAQDILLPADVQQWWVLEANGMPSLEAYTASGDLDTDRMEQMYRKLMAFLLERNGCEVKKVIHA